MKKRKRYGLIALAQALEILLCAGCGTSLSTGIPELIEPVAQNGSYRPVVIGDIGNVEVELATVVPTDYGCSFSTSVRVTEITVEPGDTVRAGDVVAYVDTQEAQESLDALQKELAYENASFALEGKISEQKIQELESDTEATAEDDTAEENSTEAAEDTNKAIETEQENRRYDTLLHQYRIKNLQASIEEQQEIVTRGTLLAEHSGLVTYVKDLVNEESAAASEDIVVISDMEEPYLELDMTVDQYPYTDYEEKYIKIGDDTCTVTEEDYSPEELILAKAANAYPKVRLNGPDTLTIGDTYPVYFQKSVRHNVPMVANDSLYEDTEGTYVYVRKESGEKTRRNIQIGEQDDHETEVVSGLSEGELVYYESDTRMPADYTTYAVTRSDFSITKSMDSYVCSDTKLSLYQADEEGIITTLAVKSDQQVKKGDLLYIIDTGVGRAAMTEAKRQIDQENRSYESTIKSYGAGESYEKQLAKLTHEYTLSQLTAAYEAVTKNNDGYGNVSVYANADGTIAACRIEEGDQVSKGDTLFDISTPATNKLVVKVDENELAPIGKEITVRKGKKSYTGHCIGWGNGTEAEKTFYVTMDDASSYENVSDGQMTYSTVSVKDVIVLPTSMIHQEGEDSFVWKWEGDELIKQYVQVSDSLTDRSQTVVLTGVDAADVLVIE